MIIQSVKKGLLNYNNMEFTELPNYIFPKGLTHDFDQKLEFSSACFWTPTKKYRFNTVEMLRFSRGLTRDFGRKLEISSQFVFGQNEPWDNVWWSSK